MSIVKCDKRYQHPNLSTLTLPTYMAISINLNRSHHFIRPKSFTILTLVIYSEKVGIRRHNTDVTKSFILCSSCYLIIIDQSDRFGAPQLTFAVIKKSDFTQSQLITTHELHRRSLLTPEP